MAITILTPSPAPATRVFGLQDGDDDVRRRAKPVLGDDFDDEDLDMLDTSDGARGGAQNKTAKNNIVTPGELVTDDPQWMRGHGTTADPFDNARISSTVAGTLTRTNKLLSVAALRSRYAPEIGDLVVGRIVQVGTKRWSVDIGAALLAGLPLAAIYLPGGVQRRRTAVDELNVRAFFSEGDLLVAEVQQLYHDGGASLHTRSMEYGKLRNGLFTSVTGAGGRAGGGGVVRSKRQIVHLDTRNGGGKVTMILGVNGFVWICKYTDDGPGAGADRNDAGFTRREDQVSHTMYGSENDEISTAMRREMHVLAGCVRALAERRVKVEEETVLRAYGAVGELEMDIDIGHGNGAVIEGQGYLGGDFGQRVVDMAIGRA